MKAQFIKLETVVITPDADIDHADRPAEDAFITVNANNISSVRRMNYNDTVQTMVLMVGGERFGVQELPEEIVAMAGHTEGVAYA